MSPRMPARPLAASDSQIRKMGQNAGEVVGFLKTVGHRGRLMLLCHLATGEKSVGELEDLLDLRQSAVSQKLARLRREGLVSTRRDGKTIYYSLEDPRTVSMLRHLFDDFLGESVDHGVHAE